MKKAQSISINTIVVAAIALLVLVVMIAIFGGRIRIFGQEARSCINQGGVEGCYTSCTDDGIKNEPNYVEGNIYISLPGTDCGDEKIGNTDKGMVCCKLLIPGKEKSGSSTSSSTTTPDDPRR